MKYKQADPTKETSCKNCIFAIYQDKIQTGCDHNRIEKFGPYVIEVYDDDCEFFVINRLCNYYRPKFWNGGEKNITKAEEESCLSFDILIDVNEMNETYFNRIKSAMQKNIYPNNKYKLYLFHDHSQNAAQKTLIKNLFDSFSNNKCILSIYSNKAEYLDSILSKSKNSYHVILTNLNIDKLEEILTTANNLINIDLKKYIILDYKNTFVISNMAYRMLYRTLYYTYENKIKEFINESKKQKVFIQIKD